mgnify:CR=1 FL=1
MYLNWQQVGEIIERALAEDIGSGDLTTNALVAEDAQAKAVILAKKEGVIAGLPVAERVFKHLDEKLHWEAKKQDGERVGPDQIVAELEGNLQAILMGERVALNLLQRMSGIATLTAKFVDAVRGLPVKILDTRKNAAGLRMLDKYAVKIGGGFNHRFGLFDGVLIKENHIKAAGGIAKAINRVIERVPHTVKIEIEVSSLKSVEEALQSGADIIMLDNMPIKEMEKAVRYIDKRALVEASGGVTLENVRQIAATGVDFISVGALTHSAKALDLSLEVLQ